MRIQDLGDLAGPVLVFGGPYSNLQATEALIARCDALGIPPERVICTGDVVAYYAGGAGCVEAVRDFGCAVVAGNCEKQLAEGAADCGCGFEEGSACDRLAAEWYAYSNTRLSQADRDWMAGLPDLVTFRLAGRRYAVIHGGLRDVARFIWPVSSEAVFAEEVEAINDVVGPVDAVVSGHSGLAFAHDVAGVSWINAGVIGMPPHDGRRETRFAMLGEQGVLFERLSYDVDGAVHAMQTAGLSDAYARALRSGIWPSEDVLPVELRR